MTVSNHTREVRISRRRFLKLAAATGGTVGLAACAPAGSAPATALPESTALAEPKPLTTPTGLPEPTPQPQITPSPDLSETPSPYSEAPMLAERVLAGDLPPVSDRLPLEPKRANALPSECLSPEIGHYGGTLRIAGPHVQYDDDGFMMLLEALLSSPGVQGDNLTRR